ncbi:hypothetical protein [Spirosoma sordidisoli]|uniref:Uncharacterized protein n=1 Tax=Spirosoma sordidisoli TaxID=2502893 RepID=A0A4V1RWM2_9BACT|nr:hypothetical protein [Spirosoma sordidisoli]RYC70758.1 hypothetical protein EQG79_00975 [Spirosoma sordidisoli]
MKEPLYVPLNCHQDYIGNRDLDPIIHKGFTVGKNGRTMYWYIIWNSWGNATIYRKDVGGIRWVPNDTMITIHFK